MNFFAGIRNRPSHVSAMPGSGSAGAPSTGEGKSDGPSRRPNAGAAGVLPKVGRRPLDDVPLVPFRRPGVLDARPEAAGQRLVPEHVGLEDLAGPRHELQRPGLDGMSAGHG